ncbi:hypothetical protein FE257_010061 [Aspergillus nanangensis]|uniref:Uncharacterized protein n=1 Tax=Aspergillus nanangensis TaxID=2582783 RepID=A0AAD4GYG4_ASPNN|nr:hypothetical protein FE257_010061 [Aspergillus nanangensis]
MHLLFLLGTTLLIRATFAQERQLPYYVSQLVSYPFESFNGTSVVEDVVQLDELDSPKIKPQVNGTVFDSWWFDAFSSTNNESITMVFYNAGPDSIGAPDLGGALFVDITGTFENGTEFAFHITAPDGAVVESGTQGIRGDWIGSGCSFMGSDLHQARPEYTVSIDNAALGVSGTLKLQSTSPPLAPCGAPNNPGSSLQIVPRIYEAFAQPDATAVVDFTIHGQPLQFTNGIGRHDKTWASAPLATSLKTWYWGHGRVGPYALTWLDAVTPDGTEYSVSLISENGEVVAQSCQPGSVVVRPWGVNGEFPPGRGRDAPEGYLLRYQMGPGRGDLVVNFTREVGQSEVDFYKRMVGKLVGGVEGEDEEVYEGRALADQFQF